MSARHSPSHLIARRAELLAEVFFQELGATFIARPTTSDLGYDLLVGFPNDKAGVNTFAVEVKATEQPVRGRFPLERRTLDLLAHSNVPGMLLVTDVKRNRLYHAWLRPSGGTGDARTLVPIPVLEVTDETKSALQRQLRSAKNAVAAVG